MESRNKPVARTKRIVIQKLKDETLVYDLDKNKALCLNKTCALAWQLCNGKRSAHEISDEMGKRLKAAVSEDLVWLALDQLNKDGLLGNGDIDNDFADFSRREIIRKVGFASVVALPMVSSLMAPEAISAQSCIQIGGNDCGNDNSQCCPNSNNCLPVGGTTGRCCANGSPGANSPGFNLCQPGPTCPSTFVDLCCSGGAFVNTTSAPCPTIGDVRCQCNPY